ncbi:MAG: maleylpyruvate isomerase N-terminal domain-containing protein [Microthrixaceae bacterium]|nr:maleylpyruvate isomerase N-terminal domain-containing protein [Microthrixaceae bacterium]
MAIQAIIEDLTAEQDALDAVVTPLDPTAWELPTPSPGWSIAHQIAHLAYFDHAAAQAMSDPEAFAAARNALIDAVMADPDSMDELTLSVHLALDPAQLLDAWRDARSELAAAAHDLPEGRRVEWYGPSMSGEVVPHGPAHGGVGPRLRRDRSARRCRGRARRTPRHRPAGPHRAHGSGHPRLVLCSQG